MKISLERRHSETDPAWSRCRSQEQKGSVEERSHITDEDGVGEHSRS